MSAQEVKLPKVKRQLDTIIVDLENALFSSQMFINSTEITGMFCYKDKQILQAIDAKIYILVTDKEHALIARNIAGMFNADAVFTNSKLAAVKEKLQLDPKTVLYLGGNYDSIPLLKEAAYSIVPTNAEMALKEATGGIHTNARAGEGALAEAIRGCIKYGLLKIKSNE